MDWLIGIRDGIRRGFRPYPGYGACFKVAAGIGALFGWAVVCGDYDDGDRIWMHVWNETPDGTIVDLTADQFGSDQVIVDREDPRYLNRVVIA